MRISHRFRFIFFCNPKTGSESVRKLLEPYSDVLGTVYRQRTPQNPFYSHMMPREAKVVFDEWGWDFDGYTKFVFVRNPWARLVSLYEMITQNAGVEAGPAGFAEWFRTIRPYGPGGGGEDWKRWRKYGTYSLDNYAGDGSGRLLVDKVIRLEDIGSELIPFLESLGLPGIREAVVPHVNRRPKKHHYTEYYSAQMVEAVRKMYAFDIERFGYDFGD